MMLKELTKKQALLLITLILILGSIVTFYGGNLLCSDLSNMFYGVHDIYIISSFPMALTILYFVLGFLFTIRYYRYPQYKKRMINLYTILFGIVALIGIVFTILTVTIIYKNLFAPYPFFGYSVIMLLVHLAIFIFSIYVNILIRKKLEDDSERRKFKVSYIVTTIVLFVLSILAFYRFGSVIYMPLYAQGRTFYMTVWFYIWACMPMAILVHNVLYFLDIYKNNKQALKYTAIVSILQISLGIVVVRLMKNYPIFISAISPALPLERLATSPIDTYIGLYGVTVLVLYYCFYCFRSVYRDSKKEK